MSAGPSTTTSHSNFVPIFNAALESYKRKTKKDLASHPLLSSLQSCDSPEAVLTVLRDQIPAFTQSENRDDGLAKWVIPTVNVLYAFSATIGQGVGLAFPPANAIFAGIGVLISAANDASASRDKLIDMLNRIGGFFHRLQIYTGITTTTAMTDMIVEIMVEVLTILAIATKEVKRGRFKKYFKKLIGNRDIEDSLERLDKLTQEEARIAAAEQLKMTHSVNVKVMGVDDRVEGMERVVEDVRSDVQDVGDKVQTVEGRVLDVRGDVQDIRDDVQDVRGEVQDVGIKVQGVDDKLDQVNRNQLRDDLLRWLSPADPSINHNIACKAHHGGTAQWFFQGSLFNNWKSTGSFLWVHGKPGSGKSVFCSSIIQDIMALRDAGDASLAYFYFDFRDVDKQKLHNLLPSFLIQLSAWSDPYCDVLSRLYSSHGRGAQKPSDRTMVECLKDMLAIEVPGPTYIIIDALDECPITSTIPSPREDVLELVDELVSLHLPNVHICVTSRPEHDIRIVLEQLTKNSVSLHDESGQQEDITKYVASFVSCNQRMRRWREEDKNLLIKTLSDKADGMFRWVFCQLEILRHCFPPSVRRVLEELPESLDETYERILREIRKPNQGHAHRLLQCLVVAVRPLRVEELAEVLAFDFNAEGMPKLNPGWRWEDQEEAVMSACSSLVIIVKNGDSRIVQFSHFSVKEFLTAHRLAEPNRDVSCYHIQLKAAHTVLAQACLGVLLRLDDRVDRDNIEGFPLARYAARHWPTHARAENVSSHIEDGMRRLFDADKPHFATWLWIYDEDDFPGSSMSTMRPEGPKAVPLYYAAGLGFYDLAERLIVGHPEHVNARGGSHETPMNAAVIAEHVDILSLLIEHGADIEGQSETINGGTPLNLAAWDGSLEVGRFLLDRGANINARDKDRHTPLMYTTWRGHLKFARMLLQRGAVIDPQDDCGQTALHFAIKYRQAQAVELLLEHGVDVNVRDEDGNTPSELASACGYQEAVELISAHAGESVEK